MTAGGILNRGTLARHTVAQAQQSATGRSSAGRLQPFKVYNPVRALLDTIYSGVQTLFAPICFDGSHWPWPEARSGRSTATIYLC